MSCCALFAQLFRWCCEERTAALLGESSRAEWNGNTTAFFTGRAEKKPFAAGEISVCVIVMRDEANAHGNIILVCSRVSWCGERRISSGLYSLWSAKSCLCSLSLVGVAEEAHSPAVHQLSALLLAALPATARSLTPCNQL